MRHSQRQSSAGGKREKSGGERTLRTGQDRSSGSMDLDALPPEKVAEALISSEEKLARLVRKHAGALASAAALVADSLIKGGRLIYVGSGTAGRIAAIDAVECIATYALPPSRIITVMAGGPRALTHPTPLEEDAHEADARLRTVAPGPRDVVCVVMLHPTPFAEAALSLARRRRSHTVLLSACEAPPDLADIVIAVSSGAAVLPADGWLSPGTGLKLLVSTLSRTTMVLIGKTYGNVILDVAPSLPRMKERAIEIVRYFTGLDEHSAATLLARAGGRPKLAIVMHLRRVSRSRAEELVIEQRGKIRPLLDTRK